MGAPTAVVWSERGKVGGGLRRRKKEEETAAGGGEEGKNVVWKKEETRRSWVEERRKKEGRRRRRRRKKRTPLFRSPPHLLRERRLFTPKNVWHAPLLCPAYEPRAQRVRPCTCLTQACLLVLKGSTFAASTLHRCLDARSLNLTLPAQNNMGHTLKKRTRSPYPHAWAIYGRNEKYLPNHCIVWLHEVECVWLKS